MIKYSKSFEDIKILTSAYLEDNDKELSENRRIGDLYAKQPARTACKLCGGV